jgi:hypothetical protein
LIDCPVSIAANLKGPDPKMFFSYQRGSLSRKALFTTGCRGAYTLRAPVMAATSPFIGRIWDKELFTKAPRFEGGHLIVPDELGRGTEPNEEKIRAHEPRAGGGLLNYRQP